MAIYMALISIMAGYPKGWVNFRLSRWVIFGLSFTISLRARNKEKVEALYQKTLFGFEAETSLNGQAIIMTNRIDEEITKIFAALGTAQPEKIIQN
jgi:hypothetical protein